MKFGEATMPLIDRLCVRPGHMRGALTLSFSHLHLLARDGSKSSAIEIFFFILVSA
jgi:hypothetical protein